VTTQAQPDRLRALRRILALEADNGFANRAVTGGIDRFLQTLARGAADNLEVHRLAAEGLLSADYAALTAAQRERWVERVRHVIGDPPSPTPAAKPPAPAKTSAAPGGVPTPPAPPPAPEVGDPVTSLRSVTNPTAEKLVKLGIRTVRDLLYHFPNRHLDYSQRRTVAALEIDRDQTVVVTLWGAQETRLGRGGRIRATEADVGDETGNMRVLWWGNPWLAQQFKRAAERPAGAPVRLALAGTVTAFQGKKRMESPEWDILDDVETARLVNTGRLLPVYPLTEGVPQRTMRRIVRDALDGVFGPEGRRRPDHLPDHMSPADRQRLSLPSLGEAVLHLHYPPSLDAFERARQRLAFDELLVLQLAMATRRQVAQTASGIPLRPNPEVVRAFVETLPFNLTEGQRKAMAEASRDMETAERPMSRLLQGDVGSGKTVVAVALLLTAVADGYQGALMAPTEVLAEQHFINVERLLSGLSQPAHHSHWFSVYVDGHPKPVSVGLLTGSTPAKARRELQARAADGTLDILIGTHALIQGDVEIPRLALAVVDEQHRFGVLQRAALRQRGALGVGEPHLLVMSATPIPRTLALTLYGDLDVSVMPELPAGRQAIMTRIVEPGQRDRAERFVVEQVSQGRQAFIVCPLIEESEAVQARAATEEYERLRTTSLRDVRVGLLHGRMPIAEKQSVMDAFRARAIDVLVATPVIEVGIDVPNATVMLIEGGDRFGLSQMHQLRGRVGRGAHQSYCFLLTDSDSFEARERLQVLVRSANGFEIAEADLRLRGPGDFFGTRQSGLPTLRVAKLSDRDILERAREEARQIVARDPSLRRQPALAAAVERYIETAADEVS